MKNTFSSEFLIQTFSFPFDDPAWARKLGIAGGLSLLGLIIPILPFLLVRGYYARLMKSVIEGQPASLPEWNDWEGDLKRGLRVWVTQLIMTLPGMVLLLPGMILLTAPVTILANQPSNSGPAGIETGISIAGVVIGSILITLGFVFLVISGILLPVIEGHVVAKSRFSAAFDVKGWWEILRRNWLGYLLAYVVFLAAMMALSLVGQILMFTIILACLFPLFLFAEIAYVYPVRAALYGQVYRDGLETLEQS